MSYTRFASYWTPAAGDDISSASFINMETGLQDELEDRLYANTPSLNGVISGLSCSISGTDIAVAAGEAYAAGKRYSGGTTVAFSGADANTYYVYLDTTDNATPYKKKTAVPSEANELLLCSVVWSGSALSGLIDRRPWGLVDWSTAFYAAGSVTTGIKLVHILPYNTWIDNVKLLLQTVPTGSAVIVDVHAGAAGSAPSTIWSTTSYRPTIQTGYTAYQIYTAGGYPETNRKLAAGSLLYVEVDQTDSSSQATGLTVLVYGRRY